MTAAGPKSSAHREMPLPTALASTRLALTKEASASKLRTTNLGVQVLKESR
jgi:hypothetical protein